MPNSDSIAISRTMGPASSTIALSMEIDVKSLLEPTMGSLIRANHRDVREAARVVAAVLKGQLLNFAARTESGSRKQANIDRGAHDRRRTPAAKGSAD